MMQSSSIIVIWSKFVQYILSQWLQSYKLQEPDMMLVLVEPQDRTGRWSKTHKAIEVIVPLDDDSRYDYTGQIDSEI
jgi:hypothetical protein